MSEDLAEYVEGTPARFVPDEMRGELVEAEHLSRYRWAAGLVRGCRVLDAGCGVGYGSVMLLEGGAREVIGVDIAEAVVEAASATGRPGLLFEQGDIGRLRHPDGSFDVVVCFEVIEHVADAQAVLAELARVLAPDGLLAISSPNRDAYVPGNPHHTREFTPYEFEDALSAIWPNVQLLRQHNWIGSAVLDDEGAVAADGEPLPGIEVRKAVGEEPGGEPYTVALASASPLPDPRRVMVLTGVTEMRRWLEHYDNQQRILDEQRQLLAEQETLARECGELRERLIEAEHELARIPDLEETRRDYDRMQVELDAVSAILNDVVSSPSWRITAPLRAAKQRLRRGGS
jgi:SAM-dependent methyltransferase